MAFRISSGSGALQAARYVDSSGAQIEKSLSSIASGSRVSRAADDAAGFAISESLRAQIAGTKQAKSNSEQAMSMVQTAEGGLNEQNNILVRLRELAVNSASDTVGDKEREYIDGEFQQLTSEFDRIAKTTRYGNKQLLTGSNENFEFQVGPYNSADDVIKFKLDADTSASKSGVSGLGVADQDGARSALDQLDDSIAHVSSARAGFGAMQSRFEHAVGALGVQAENLTAARSQIVDVDVAEESAKLSAAQIQHEAGISVMAQANQVAGRALRLIG